MNYVKHFSFTVGYMNYKVNNKSINYIFKCLLLCYIIIQYHIQ